MPAYFQFFEQDQTEASTLQAVDDAVCAHLGVPVHPEKYCYGWYDSIGLAVAMGADWDKIRDQFKKSQIEMHRMAMQAAAGTLEPKYEGDSRDEKYYRGAVEHYAAILMIVDFMSEHYRTSAWYQTRCA